MVKYLEDNNFDGIVSKGITLVDFYADWCGPCKMMGTILEELDNVNILKVNTDKYPELAQKFGIMSIPTLILIKDGVEIKKSIGLVSKTEIENFINE